MQPHGLKGPTATIPPVAQQHVRSVDHVIQPTKLLPRGKEAHGQPEGLKQLRKSRTDLPQPHFTPGCHEDPTWPFSTQPQSLPMPKPGTLPHLHLLPGSLSPPPQATRCQCYFLSFSQTDPLQFDFSDASKTASLNCSYHLRSVFSPITSKLKHISLAWECQSQCFPARLPSHLPLYHVVPPTLRLPPPRVPVIEWPHSLGPGHPPTGRYFPTTSATIKLISQSLAPVGGLSPSLDPFPACGSFQTPQRTRRNFAYP